MAKGLMLFSGLLFFGASAAAQNPQQPPPPVGADSEGMFFLSYPRVSLRENEQGIVEYRLNIDRDGTAKDCIVTESSGHERLDRVTCKGAARYARFQPAFDGDGNRIRSAYTGKVIWKTR